MSEPIVGIVIPADPDQPIRLHRLVPDALSVLKACQETVGGYVESIASGREDLVVLINEEAKILNPPFAANDRATSWWFDVIEQAGLVHLPGEYIAGDMLLVGMDRDEGDYMDVPLDVQAALVPASAGIPT